MKISAALIAVFAVALITFITVDPIRADNENADRAAQSTAVLTDDAYRLTSAADGKVNLVEFLDFECEACGAFYPVVEDLRERYDGEITYVIRYFPLPGHLNSRNAAFAAEAAAQQGRLEEMYRKLFETQAQWGEAQESRASLFRGFAEEIGLDMAAYDAAISDPATVARVDLDYNDGQALGVSGTPTFFVNGDAITLERYDDLENAILSASKRT